MGKPASRIGRDYIPDRKLGSKNRVRGSIYEIFRNFKKFAQTERNEITASLVGVGVDR
jgi:hypothetical protein